jgi:hypothetical protein
LRIWSKTTISKEKTHSITRNINQREEWVTFCVISIMAFRETAFTVKWNFETKRCSSQSKASFFWFVVYFSSSSRFCNCFGLFREILIQCSAMKHLKLNPNDSVGLMNLGYCLYIWVK